MKLPEWDGERYALRVCPACYLTAAGYERDAVWEESAGPKPWALWPGGAGHAFADDGDPSFSRTPCDGCGNRLAGSRYRATYIQREAVTP